MSHDLSDLSASTVGWRELSLFTGGGGGVWASRSLGWRTVGYVEYDRHCQAVIKARIADGTFDDAPIFGDIRSFLANGYADVYAGRVEIVSGGFPCQPFSVAGKQRAGADERNMWPATADVIRRVAPTVAFLENVPGLLSSGYFGVILEDLAAMGYRVRWGVVSAAAAGARHLRKRLWILAHAHCPQRRLDES